MKKIFQTLVLILATQAVFSQNPCQASFSYTYDGQSLLSLYDNSFNFDSTLINVTAWSWTAIYGGATYTYSVENPVIQVSNFFGMVYVCLTIATGSGCTSTACDTISLNSQPTSCEADFTWQTNGSLFNYSFTDLSSAGNPASSASITSWSWTVIDSLQGTSLSSGLQNPSFTFPGTGIYDVCLTINTDSGCNDTQCYYLVINDTIQNGCNLYVIPDISDVTVIGGNDGFIDLTVTGNNPPFTFTWSNGAVTEDVYGLSSGIYTVMIGQNDTVCPPYSYTFQILEPYQNVPIDTLLAPPIDTCLNFTVDTFFVTSLGVQGNVVTVTWQLMGGGMTSTFSVTYTFGNYGTYMVVLEILCSKTSGTYMTYINITNFLGVEYVCKEDINIYPNPFTGSFNLTLPEFVNANIQIFNSTGQIVYNTRTANMNNTVDASQWPSGIYLVRITNGNRQLITRTVVKQ